MPRFRYTALTPQQEHQKGMVDAPTERAARDVLRQKQWTVLTIKAVQPTQKMNQKTLSLFTRQLATLIAAGIPLETALIAVSEQTEKASAKSLILTVKSKITEGHSFANALRDYPEAFSETYCSGIAAGEKSAHLEQVLNRLADHIDHRYQTQQRIVHALIYPVMMLLIAIAIIGFLLTYVVPKMIAVYTSSGQSLPTLTNALILISHVIHSFGLMIALTGTIASFIFLHRLKKNNVFRMKVHAALLKLPLFGNAIKTIHTARFSRTFSLLFASGVPVIEAMKTAALQITSIPIYTKVQDAILRVKEGATIHLALKQTHFFSALSLQLIASGEASGQLETMLERAALHQETEIKRLIETSLALLEPLIILVMGVVVLFIVLAVLLPIFQLNEM